MTKDRLICSIRDSSRKSLLPYVPGRKLLVRSVKKDSHHWLPGENYVSCSRFKRILHDDCIPKKKPEVCTTTCTLCKGQMKVKIFPSMKGKKKIIVEEVWRGELPPENPKIQELFENWLETSSHDCAKYTDTKNTRFRKPHHYYHHNLIKTGENPQAKSDKYVFCAGCPDPYRSWIRKKNPDHCVEPVLIPRSKTEEEKRLESEYNEKSQAKKVLKKVLNNILAYNKIRKHVVMTV